MLLTTSKSYGSSKDAFKLAIVHCIYAFASTAAAVRGNSNTHVFHKKESICHADRSNMPKTVKKYIVGELALRITTLVSFHII